MKPLVLFTLFVLAAPAMARGQRTDNPHGDLREACSTCHRADRWAPAQIDKSFRHAPGAFPLEGAHAGTKCLACHERLDFKETPRTCATCHEDVHRGELGAECGRCHTPRSFVDRAAMGIAHETTRFPLRGAHIGAACEDCHTPASPGQLQFVNRSTTCEGCHAAQARTVTEPNHQGPGFGNCSACHTVIAWTGARFDHSLTAFPLTGAHRAVSCDGCHGDQVFKGKTTQCVGCHQADYDNTQAPPHASSGFATTCATCHTTTGWTGSAFNHAATQFPLTGAHVAQPCTACHGDGVYRGKPTDCYACHQSDYTATTTPNHSAAQFSIACASCHTTTAWQGATFNHDASYFPVYSGKHRGKWSTCAQCHTNPANYQVFTCLTCHEHNQTDMDAEHANRAGYRYESQSCYACHPRGD